MNMVKIAEMVADILVSLVLGNRHHCSGSEVTEGSGGWKVCVHPKLLRARGLHLEVLFL